MFDVNKIKLEYFIGIDTYDDKSPTYCLMRRTNSSIEIVISKTMHNQKQAFWEEVKNLTKYFNATVLKGA